MDLKRQKSKISISRFLFDVLCHLRRMKSGSFLAQDVGLLCLALLVSGCGDNLEKIESVNVSLAPQKAPEGIDFESQREILESASLAGEMLAESYGQWMEAIWDDVKASKDKLGVFSKLEFTSMQWGQWSDQRRIDHDIGLHDLQPSSKNWMLDEWRSWLEEIKSAGIELEQMQWRHVGFMAHDDRYSSPVSEFTFEFHAKRGEPATRWILRGGMDVIWYSGRKSNVFAGVKHIEVTEATLLQRDGPPPFEHVVAADVSPADQDLVLEPNLQVLDLDGDFEPEIILSRINRVFWNQGSGRFRTGSLLEFPLAQFHQGIVADFSGNALLDFLAVTTEGLALYEGDGKGAFAKAPRRQDLFNGQLINPFVLTSGDIDGDSDLDVWLGQYKVPYENGQMPAPFFDANDGHPAFLLLNEGNGTFSDATIEAGLESKRFRRTYSASLVDLDHDLDLDLAVVSDFSGVDFYRNDGSGHFEDVTSDWGGNRYGFGMAHLLGDWNLDQRLDLLMIGMHSAAAERMATLGIRTLANATDPSGMRQAMSYGNRVFWGNENGVQQVAGLNPMRQTGWSWGAANIDFDLDGDQDVYIVNGHITGARTYDYESEFWREDLSIGNSREDSGLSEYFESKQLRYQQAGASYGGNERNQFFLNLNGKEWVEVAYLFGLAMPEDCRNVVAADFDGNGLPDLAVTTFELWPDERQVMHLFPNFHQTKNHWIGFKLRESRDWPPLMGAQLQIKYQNKTLTRPIITGDGYRSQSPYRFHFGIGQTDQIDEMILQWPDGTRHSFTPEDIDRYHLVEPVRR